MASMVQHEGFWCERVHVGWRVRRKECATGQVETLISKRYAYQVQTDAFDDPLARVQEVDQSGTLAEEERLAKKAEALAWKAGQRAKRNCRWKIKEAGFDELLTITYRENQIDLALCRKNFAAWLRKMRRAIPGFRGVWAFEQQKRGAWHVHVCCDRLPMLIHYRGARVKSWRVGTALWREVVGVSNGLVFVGGKGGRFNRYRSCAKMAGYVSKYLTKHHGEGVKHARMWDSTQGISGEKPLVVDLPLVPLWEVISAAWDLPEGHVVVQHQSANDDWWLMYSEPDPDRPADLPVVRASGRERSIQLLLAMREAA